MDLKELYSRIGDYGAAMERFGGNEKMLSRFLKRFPSDKSYESLILAYEHNDAANVYWSAVTLCEVCGSLALTALGETAKAIIDVYRTTENTTREIYNVPMLMNILEVQYKTVVENIKALE